MKETQNYDLKFIRYLLNTHQEKICAMESVSSKNFINARLLHRLAIIYYFVHFLVLSSHLNYYRSS